MAITSAVWLLRHVKGAKDLYGENLEYCIHCIYRCVTADILTKL